MLLSERYYPNDRRKCLQEECVLTLPKHCIIPGFITNGIMISGGPKMFLSRNSTALPPLLKLFENKEITDIRSKPEKLSDIKLCKTIVEKKISINDAKELLPKWLSEGTMRTDVQKIIQRNIFRKDCAVKMQSSTYLTTCNAAEAFEILQPSSQSISRAVLLARFTNGFLNSPKLQQWTTHSLNTIQYTSNSSHKTAFSYLTTLARIYDVIKNKDNKSHKLNNLLTLLLAVLVTAATWKLIVIRAKIR